MQYTSKNRIVQSEMRELASCEKGRMEPNSDDQWKNELLYIPPIPPTNLRGCNLIRIQYDVHVGIYTDIILIHFKLLIRLLVPGYTKRCTQNNQTTNPDYDGNLSTSKLGRNTSKEKGNFLPINSSNVALMDE